MGKHVTGQDEGSETGLPKRVLGDPVTVPCKCEFQLLRVCQIAPDLTPVSREHGANLGSLHSHFLRAVFPQKSYRHLYHSVPSSMALT